MLTKSLENSQVPESGTSQTPLFIIWRILGRQGKFAILILLSSLVVDNIWAFDSMAKIREGVKHHDAGDYAAAIKIYRSILEVENGNGLAWYELANSYFAKGDFDSCISAAKKGRKNSSNYEVDFFTISGNCYSSNGKAKKALKSFRSGLKIAPDNAGLNFNIAITLFNSGDHEGAIKHLEAAIDGKPSYSSPYYLLGEIYRVRSERVQSLFYLSRFFTLETDTSRSVAAAGAVLELLSSGIAKKSEGNFEIMVSTAEGSNSWTTLELSLSIAVLAAQMEEGIEHPSAAHRNVEALTSFFQIVLEMSERELDLKNTKVWRQAIAPILEIHLQETSEALGFLMAMKADVEGAAQWLEANPGASEGFAETLTNGTVPTDPHSTERGAGDEF